MLPLAANLLGSPPDRGVIKQERLQHILQQIDEIIVPPDMGQLMGQHGFELRLAQTGQQGGRHEHDRPGPANHHRHARRGGPQQPHGRRDADALLEARKTCAPHVVFLMLPLSPQSPDHPPPDCEAHGKEDDADDPQTDQPVKPRSPRISRLGSLCRHGNYLSHGRKECRLRQSDGNCPLRRNFHKGIVARDNRANGDDFLRDRLKSSPPVRTAVWQERGHPGSHRASCGLNLARPQLP